MTNFENLKRIFELGRPITQDDSNKYVKFAFRYKLDNYRLISSGELLIKGNQQGLHVPQYMKEFINFHGEAVMIANKINDKVVALVLRSIHTKKEFMKIGITKSIFYGLGDLSKDFTYGTPIVLVEGHLDRDVFSKLIYNNTLAVTTNKLSKSQIKVLTSLTDNVILMLDNDDSGQVGISHAIKELRKHNVKTTVLKHLYGMKDAGDLIELERINKQNYMFALGNYKRAMLNNK